MPNSTNPAAARLENLSGVLAASLARWSHRDEPGARQAANTAAGAIDGMLAELHAARQQLLGEVRAHDDATAARVDAMLAGRAADR